MSTIEFHELANIFPLIQGGEFNELKADLEKSGLATPIVMFEGKILDGRNRFRACQETGVEARFEEYSGNDPLGYVISLNLQRRHLSESGRAMVAAKLANLGQGQRKDRADPQICGTTQTKAAQQLNVSERSVNTAKKVYKQDRADVASRVEDGKLAVSAAAKIVSFSSEDKQREILKKLDSGEVKNVVQAIRRVEQEERIASAPVITDNRCRIVNGDCVDLIKRMGEMPSLIITDPPYGIDTHNTRRGGADYADGGDYAHSLLGEVCSALQVKASPDAHLYFFSGYSNAYSFKQILSQYFEVQDNPIIWIKENHTMCDFSKSYPNRHEYIWFCRQKGSERKLADCIPDVISCKRERSSTHSAEKPTDLIKTLIEQSSLEGEVVCDPFLGSGSTGVAAKDLGRQFVGFELDKDWYDVAASRLA